MTTLELITQPPSVPEELSFLEVLSGNLWWSWNHDAQNLFRRLDPHLWHQCENNPRKLLAKLSPSQLQNLASNGSFLEQLDRVKARFDARGRLAPSSPAQPRACIAYFSLEYGIHESIQLYSGGLGGLAGDHLKTASDFQLPLVAVGLLYHRGYFQQYLDEHGWQREDYPENNIEHLPLQKVYDHDHRQLNVCLPLPDGRLKALVWRLDVGRVPLYLLDTNIPDNSPEHRQITSQLYCSDRQTRLRQELLLGIGGIRALHQLGHRALVCHTNEGHAAFISLARISALMTEAGYDLPSARDLVRRTSIFTTHTPVPAGNEVFHVDLLRPHLQALEDELGLSPDQIIGWGQHSKGPRHELCMTTLGLNMANYSNGVSKLHGEVARTMWSHLWPDQPRSQVPIGHVTNGVHIGTWLAPEYYQLYDRYLGPGWQDNPSNPDILRRVEQLPNDKLWKTHELERSRLIKNARDHLVRQHLRRNASQAEILRASTALDRSTLTIGFARRFATYKRATLLLQDPQRFLNLLRDNKRPVQFLFAGKAHPADDCGKELIRQIIEFAKAHDLQHRIVFLENYDMRIARQLVHGVDVWLNTPRRLREASGTSGMKAAINGGLHLSVLDGWWPEAYQKGAGWAIGDAADYADPIYQDMKESQALYNLLTNEVIPAFYNRDADGLPGQWLQMMKNSIRTSLGYFTSHRMVTEYHARFYAQALREYKHVALDKAGGSMYSNTVPAP